MHTSSTTLRAARRRRQWTQVQLARRAGIAQSTVSRIEAGRSHPAIGTVRALERALGLSRGALRLTAGGVQR